MSCNSNDTVHHLHLDHFTWIFHQLQHSHLGLCQQFQKGNWLCLSSTPLLLDCNSTTIFSCLIPFSIQYLICDAASPHFSLQMQWHSACSFHYSLFPRTTTYPRGLGLPPLPISIFGLMDSCFTISNKRVGFRTSYCEYQFGDRWEVCSAARQLETNLKMHPEGASTLGSPTPAAGQSADSQERQEKRHLKPGRRLMDTQSNCHVWPRHSKWWIPAFLWK